MELRIKPLRRCDYKKAIWFAISGMHFHWYLDSPLLLYLYGAYFWYLELGRATQIIAAYTGDDLVGVLLAELRGEPRRYRSPWAAIYVKLAELVQKLFVRGGTGIYDEANQEMFAHYCQDATPDGELIFLAADPDSAIRGIGTLLLQELERRAGGREIFLYTDNACTYQFYEHRGFSCAAWRDVTLRIGPKIVPLRCLLYRKRLSSADPV